MRNRVVVKGNEPWAQMPAVGCAGAAGTGRLRPRERRAGSTVGAVLAALASLMVAGTAAGQAVLPHALSARPAFAASVLPAPAAGALSGSSGVASPAAMASVPGPEAGALIAGGQALVVEAAPPAAMATSGGQAFAIEATGAVVGSLVGFSTIYLSRDRCDVEDLSCNLETVFGGIVLGTAGATAGAWLAGRAGDTDPSLAGAALGAVVGVGAGIGLWHLFTEELDIVNEPFAAALTYSFAQGVTTALGSRLVRRLRR